MKIPNVSIVVPVYNEQVYLQDFYDKCLPFVGRNYEFVFVNDGSTDFSKDILDSIAAKNPNVKIVTLERNYGKQIAITAGMAHTSGQAVIVCSVKNGQPFSIIPKLLDEHFKGAHIVRGYFEKRHKGFAKFWQGFKTKLLKAVLWTFISKMPIIEKPDIELYDRAVADIINSVPQRNMFLRRTNIIFGFRIITIDFEERPSSKEDKEVFTQNKKKFEQKRKDLNLPNMRVPKKRMYIKSLWASYAFWVAFAVLLGGVLALVATNSGTAWIAITATAAVSMLLLSIAFLARASIIRLVGALFDIKKDQELYKVSTLTNF